jgi:hypothetical protein
MHVGVGNGSRFRNFGAKSDCGCRVLQKLHKSNRKEMWSYLVPLNSPLVSECPVEETFNVEEKRKRIRG